MVRRNAKFRHPIFWITKRTSALFKIQQISKSHGFRSFPMRMIEELTLAKNYFLNLFTNLVSHIASKGQDKMLWNLLLTWY